METFINMKYFLDPWEFISPSFVLYTLQSYY